MERKGKRAGRRGAAIARALVLLALIAGGEAADAQTEWTAELLATPARRTPTDPVRLRLPALRPEALQRLAVEVNDLDVSAMVAVQGQILEYAPPQPFALGVQQVRLLEYAPDGSIREVGSWSLEVRQSEAFRESTLEGNARLLLSGRVADKNLQEPKPDARQDQGGLQLRGALANGSWRATGAADFLYASDNRLLPRGAQAGYADVGTFLFTFAQGPVVAQAGHFQPVPNSLIASGFQRRGVSLGVAAPDGSFGGSIFGVRTQNLVGFTQGLGIGDSDNTTSGAVLTARPLKAQRDALALTATYLAGKDPGVFAAGGGAQGSGINASEGSAASIVADSLLLGRSLRLRGEYASTQFDPDQDGGDDAFLGYKSQPRVNDHGYALLAQYAPQAQAGPGGQPFAWSIAAENRRIGTYFRSIANPAGIADRDMSRVFGALNWSGVDGQLSLGRETDNVADLAILPRVLTEQRFGSLAYSPPPSQPAPDGRLPTQPWYGQPAYHAAYGLVSRRVDRPTLDVPVGRLSEIATLSIGASFIYSTWNWSASLTDSDVEDFTNASADTRSRTLTLSASARIGEKMSVNPVLQYGRNTPRDVPAGWFATETKTTTAGVGLSYAYSARLSGSLQYNVADTQSECQCQDSRTQDLTGSVTWLARPAEGWRPGVAFSLLGQYHDVSQASGSPLMTDSYQIFLRMELTASPRL